MAEVIKKKKPEETTRVAQKGEVLDNNIKPITQPTIVGKQTYTLGNRQVSKEEFQAAKGLMGFDGSKGQVANEGIRNLVATVEREALKNKVKNALQQNATLQEVTNQLIQEEAFKTTPKTEESQNVIQTPQEQEAQNEKGLISEDSVLTKIGRKIAPDATADQRFFNLSGAKTAAFETALSAAANVYDFIYSLTQGGKGIQQKEAELTFSRIQSDILQDLNLVKIGLKDPVEVKQKIALANDAIQRLETSTKGLGKYNLRYWLVDGQDVEAQIIINKQAISDYQRQLEVAVQEASILEARQKYGLQT